MEILGLFLLSGFCFAAVLAKAPSPAFPTESFHITKNGTRVAKCEVFQAHDPYRNHCYRVGMQRPCGLNMRFYRQAENPLLGECRCVERSWWEPPLVFWPAKKVCHQLFTEGPCNSGQWLVPDQSSGRDPACAPAECDMEEELPYWLFQFAFNHTCYTTGTQGPCPPNHQVMFDPVSGPLCFLSDSASAGNGSPSVNDPLLGNRSPRCASIRLAYDPARGKCYEIDSPCGLSRIFVRTEKNIYHGECRCMEALPYQPKRVFSEDHDDCFPLFSQGPCKDGEWLIPGSDGDPGPVCAHDKCSNLTNVQGQQNQFVHENTCYVLGSGGGACPEKLVLGFDGKGPICYADGIFLRYTTRPPAPTISPARPFECPPGMELTSANGCRPRAKLRPRMGANMKAN